MRKEQVMKNLGGKAKVLFSGRTVRVMVDINTDEDEVIVAKRVHDAACGPHKRMAVTSVAETKNDPDYWSKIFEKIP
jgi:hypothetical protein